MPPLPPQIPEPWPPNELYAIVIIRHYPTPGNLIIKRHTGQLEVLIQHERYRQTWDPGPDLTQLNMIYSPLTRLWQIEVTADWLSNWIGQLAVHNLSIPNVPPFDTGILVSVDDIHSTHFYCRVTL